MKRTTEETRHIQYVQDFEDTVIALALCPANGQNPHKTDCTWGQPGLFWGSPGIGKSQRMGFASLCVSLPWEVLIAATHQPESVSGALVPDMRGGANIMSLLPGVSRLIQNQQGILFLDELSCARPAVQAAFLNVVLERRVGDTKLPGGVRVMAAANPAEEAVGGWELDPPMANRFVHLFTRPPTANQWVDWLMNDRPPSLQPIEDAEDVIRRGWNDTYARSKGLAAGYLRSCDGDSKLYAIPPEGSPERGRAWPSPRTWEMALRLLTTCRILDKPKLVSILLAGCLGPGVASEFEVWMAQSDLPDPLDVIAGRWSPDIRRLDRVVAAYTTATAMILQQEDKKVQRDMALDYWRALKIGMDQGAADIVKNMAASLVTSGLGRSAGADMAAASQPVQVMLAKSGFGDYL